MANDGEYGSSGSADNAVCIVAEGEHLYAQQNCSGQLRSIQILSAYSYHVWSQKCYRLELTEYRVSCSHHLV